MRSIQAFLGAAGLVTFAHAYTKPGASTWGPLLTPDLSQPITQGKEVQVTWDPESHPTDGVTVSLVLCHGASSNCVPADTAIASGIPADQKSFNWSVPCDLAPGKQSTDTGYGMLIIVDGTGEFQYSTQFSCLENASCASSAPSNTTTTSSANSSASVAILPPFQVTESSSIPANATAPETTTVTSDSAVSTTGPNSSTAYLITSTTVVGYTSAATTGSAGTVATAGSGSTGSASGPSATPSTFAGGAAQLIWNIGGIFVAGAATLFAL
ncbi:hypothetical protein A1O1_02655 [Capronia coronata CBS 617.96]|uniref:Yeast cell wall synthesis Kre9/Knh1-like N-terminal domain-containing protein n=1 Tax=Capronia coronata CBS 617.96 TaxID=1182541 RepID=W9YMV8_9EURO|nr:uncharacterized protein A1O1_02655 [Capronia coronata CBS 617.96]EXJ94262.1 hypothetical protein A1O1_02655 [Capronia coronata CBS 617.96]